MIRIYSCLAEGGRGSRWLWMSQMIQDQSENKAAFTFCINKDLLAQVQGVKIDLTYMGFAVEPTVPLAAADGGSACGSCSSGCGSH